MGTHTYRVSGYKTIRFTATGPTNSDTGESSISLDRDPVEVTPKKPDVAKHRSIKGTLATFIDEDGDSTDPDRYRVYHAALIDWGDGSFDFGDIFREADGTFRVDGAHSYAKPGEYFVKMFVRRNVRHLPGMYPPIYYDGVVALNSDGRSAQEQLEEYSAILFKVRVGKGKPKVHRKDPDAPPLQRAASSAAFSAASSRAALFSKTAISAENSLFA